MTQTTLPARARTFLYAQWPTFCREHRQCLVILYGLCWAGLWTATGLSLGMRIPRTALILLFPLVFPLLKERTRVFFTPLFLLTAAFLGAAFLSTLLSDIAGRPGVLFDWLIYLCAGYIAAELFEWNALRITAAGLFAGLALSLVIAWGGYLLGLLPPPLHSNLLRLTLFNVWPTRLALIAAAPIVWTVYLRLHGKGVSYRWVDLFCVLFSGAVLCATAARSAIVALCLTAGLLLLARLPLRKVVLWMGLAACFAVGTFSLLPDTAGFSKTRLLSVFANPLQDSSVRTRLPIWEIALDNIKKRPLLGSGVQTFKTVHKEYLQANRAALHKRYGESGVENSITHPHNFVLLVLSDTGILGTALFAAILVLAALAGLRGLPPAGGCLALLAMYMLHAAMNSALYQKEAGAFFFTTLGMLLAFSLSPCQEKRK